MDEKSIFQSDTDPIMQYFEYGHLPDILQEISKPYCTLASKVVKEYPRNAERTVTLRKLLEAKDAAVRCNLTK